MSGGGTVDEGGVFCELEFTLNTAESKLRRSGHCACFLSVDEYDLKRLSPASPTMRDLPLNYASE